MMWHARNYSRRRLAALIAIHALPVSLLSALAQPATIVTQPLSQNALPGQVVTFSVVVTGALPFAFQWRYNGANLVGETNDTLVVPFAHPTNSGMYSVVVKNDFGPAVTSIPARLFVPAPLHPFMDNFDARVITNSFTGIRRGSNTLATVEPGEPQHAGKVGGHSVWFGWTAPASGVATFRTRGSSFDTLLAVYTGTSVANLTSIVSDEDSGGFYASEVRFNADAGASYAIAIDGLGDASGDIVLNWSLNTSAAAVPIILTQPTSRIVPFGSTATFQVSGTNATAYQWFADGTPIPDATGPQLVVSNVSFVLVGVYKVRVFNNSQFVDSVPVVLEAGPGDVTPTVEKFEDLFASNSVPISTSMVTVNSGARTQQREPNHGGIVGGASRWQLFRFNTDGVLTVTTAGTAIPAVLAAYTGMSLAELTLVPNESIESLGFAIIRFRVNAGVEYPVAIDTPPGLTGRLVLNWNFIPAPRLTTAFDRIPLVPGSNVLLSVNVEGANEAFTYQWSRGATPIPDATQPTLLVTNVRSESYGIYHLAVTYLGFVIAEREIELVEVGPQPVIVNEPADLNGVSGRAGALSADVIAAQSISYQWYKQNSKGQFKSVRGATNATFTIEKLSSKSGGIFQLVATNSSGSATSRTARLTVYVAAGIKTQPRNISTVMGRKVTLKAKATGTALRYQWYFNDAPIADATASRLVITNVQPEHAGTYYLAVSNPVSMTNSQPASLTVESTPAISALAAVQILTEPLPRMLIEKKGDEVRLFITAPSGQYEVLVSSDLREWQVAGELNAGSGSATFAHRTSASASFYRLLRTGP